MPLPKMPVTNCPHTDREHKALGLCNACYLRQSGSTRRWYQKNKQKTINRAKDWGKKNKERRLEISRNWSRKDYKRNRSKWIRRSVERYRTPGNYRFAFLLRCKLRARLKNNKKADTTFCLIGCSAKDLRKYLESRFKPGMNWGNYGRRGWHIDHIKPCASFDLSDPEQQRQCFHYTNLQPLWAYENWSKGAKVR